MRHILLFSVIALFCFLGVDCKDKPPIVPPDDKPDTTSHNFTFTTYTFGGTGGSSYFKDVAIINDSDIWAVGAIYTSPETTYNAAHWDGNKWRLIQIPTEIFGGAIRNSILTTVFAFSTNDVWTFSIAGSYSHWNGSSWETHFVSEISGGGLKFWGSNSNNLYLVGTNGAISHYAAGSWSKLESGTTLDIQDIWGATNTTTGQQEILAVASNKFLDQGKKLLQIKGSTVSVLADSGLSWSLSGVWFVPGKQYYVVGDGLYPSTTLGPIWNRVQTFPAYYKDAIRGSSWNNVVVCGSNGLLSHFNGTSWKHYMNDEIPSFVGRYYGVAISSNCIVSVGYVNNEAIATVGKRK